MSYWMQTTTDQLAPPQDPPVQVIGGLVQEGVILSDKLSPDQLGTWLLHHHFFGQLEISGEEPAELKATNNPATHPSFNPALKHDNQPEERHTSASAAMVTVTAQVIRVSSRAGYECDSAEGVFTFNHLPQNKQNLWW